MNLEERFDTLMQELQEMKALIKKVQPPAKKNEKELIDMQEAMELLGYRSRKGFLEFRVKYGIKEYGSQRNMKFDKNELLTAA